MSGWLSALHGVRQSSVMGRENSGSTSRVAADGTVHVEDTRGKAQLVRMAPGVLLFVCQGVLSARCHRPMIEFTQRELDAGRQLSIFVDGWNLHAVETEFREAWTLWFKENRGRFHMRLLVRSKLMDMAASLANLFTGATVVKTYSSLGSWEQACVADYPPFRARERVSA